MNPIEVSKKMMLALGKIKSQKSLTPDEKVEAIQDITGVDVSKDPFDYGAGEFNNDAFGTYWDALSNLAISDISDEEIIQRITELPIPEPDKDKN